VVRTKLVEAERAHAVNDVASADHRAATAISHTADGILLVPLTYARGRKH
jgi:hypothetical protein